MCNSYRLAKTLYEEGYEKVDELTKRAAGTWSNYSATMMECSNCKKHVPYHRYKFCPHCGSKNKMKEYTND